MSLLHVCLRTGIVLVVGKSSLPQSHPWLLTLCLNPGSGKFKVVPWPRIAESAGHFCLQNPALKALSKVLLYPWMPMLSGIEGAIQTVFSTRTELDPDVLVPLRCDLHVSLAALPAFSICSCGEPGDRQLPWFREAIQLVQT